MPNEAEVRRWNDEEWAAGWFKREALTDAVTPVLLAAVGARPGERLLDIGCGGGRTTLALAAAVGPTGSVTGVDLSEPILAVAGRRVAEAGVTTVDLHRADAQVDGLGADPYDAAVSQFGIMFFDDPVTAFTNIRRHVRPGGRLAAVCWQATERNPWFLGPVLAPFVPPPPPPPEGREATGPFTLGDPARVEQVLVSAGWSDIAIRPEALVAEAPADAIGDGHQLAFMGVAAADMAAATAALDRHRARFGDPAGLCRFPLAFQVVTARAGTA